MKVVVIGAGMVGSAVTGQLLAQGAISDIILLDIDREKAEGEVLDYSHTSSYNYNPSANLKVGDYSDCKDADIIVMAAGSSAVSGGDRMEMADTNTKVMNDVMEQVIDYNSEAIIIPVSNPVDLLSYTAVKKGYDRKKVIGTGTIVDSARLMSLLGKKYNLDPKNIFGYLLGEHGKSSFIPWSIAGICGYDFATFAQIRGLEEELDKEKIEEEVKEMGFKIWRRKGYTNHGIAAGVNRIVKAIALDEQAVLPVSVYLTGEYGIDDIALSVPCIVGEAGIEKVLEFPLEAEEQEKLEQSAESLQRAIEEVGI